MTGATITRAMIEREKQRRAALQQIREIADLGMQQLHELLKQKKILTIEEASDAAQALRSYKEIIESAQV